MSKCVKDCIYRFIEIPELCVQFADHPLFQRLRRIRQLGLAHYVFPSAVHTRFEHSLGVMHLAGVVVEQLKKFVKISERHKHLVQLAGMLHDIGHFAFSHLFDLVLENSTDLNIDQKEHEDRSVTYLNSINEELKLLEKEEVKMVAAMIHGHQLEEYPNYLFQIVCNARNGLDVDKMDYLQRDAYHTGLTGFQSDYIIQNMAVIDGNNIVIYRKAETEVQDLYVARKRMFTNVYYHRVCSKIEKYYLCLMTRNEFIEAVNKTEDSLLDDFRVETMLRDLFPNEMAKIDRRDINHSCYNCGHVILEKTPKLNGKVSGDGKVSYI